MLVFGRNTLTAEILVTAFSQKILFRSHSSSRTDVEYKLKQNKDIDAGNRYSGEGNGQISDGAAAAVAPNQDGDKKAADYKTDEIKLTSSHRDERGSEPSHAQPESAESPTKSEVQRKAVTVTPSEI